MRKIIQIGCFIAMFMLVSFATQAQKVGFIDSDAILAEMPQVKQAQANLEVLRKQLTTKGQQMVTDFQTKYQDLAKKEQEGKISRIELETEAKKLEAKQAEIGKYEQDMVKQLQDREAKELQPIFDKVSQAIKDVAKENGYSFVFEKRTLLYFDEAMDIGSLVKAKLGM